MIFCVSGVYHQYRIRFRVSRVLSEKFSKYVYMYIIKSGDIYERGERNDSQIRVAPPRNNTHTIAFHYFIMRHQNDELNRIAKN